MTPMPRRKLTTADFDGKAVTIKHDDGSVLFFENAFCEFRGRWVNVFTEHLGYHRFYRGSCDVTRRSK